MSKQSKNLFSKQRFSLRKLTVGTASVMLGMTLFTGAAHAQTDGETTETATTEAPATTETATTEAPATTEAATTEAATTETPSTEAPATTETATTEAATIEAPAVTEAPSTEAATTEAPAVTEAPSTETPSTEAATTEAATTEAPAVTEAATAETPSTEAVTTETVTTETVTTEAVTTEAATSEAPQTEAPSSAPQQVTPETDTAASTPSAIPAASDLALHTGEREQLKDTGSTAKNAENDSAIEASVNDLKGDVKNPADVGSTDRNNLALEMYDQAGNATKTPQNYEIVDKSGKVVAGVSSETYTKPLYSVEEYGMTTPISQTDYQNRTNKANYTVRYTVNGVQKTAPLSTFDPAGYDLMNVYVDYKNPSDPADRSTWTYNDYLNLKYTSDTVPSAYAKQAEQYINLFAGEGREVVRYTTMNGQPALELMMTPEQAKQYLTDAKLIGETNKTVAQFIVEATISSESYKNGYIPFSEINRLNESLALQYSPSVGYETPTAVDHAPVSLEYGDYIVKRPDIVTTETSTETLKAGVVYQGTDTLKKGESAVLTQGRDGSARNTYIVTRTPDGFITIRSGETGISVIGAGNEDIRGGVYIGRTAQSTLAANLNEQGITAGYLTANNITTTQGLKDLLVQKGLITMFEAEHLQFDNLKAAQGTDAQLMLSILNGTYAGLNLQHNPTADGKTSIVQIYDSGDTTDWKTTRQLKSTTTVQAKQDTVIQVGNREVTKAAIPYTTRYVLNSQLAKGQTVIQQAGRNGEMTTTVLYNVNASTGALTEASRVSAQTLAMIEQIIQVGGLDVKMETLAPKTVYQGDSALAFKEMRTAQTGTSGTKMTQNLYQVDAKTGALALVDVKTTEVPATNTIIKYGNTVTDVLTSPYDIIYQADPTLDKGIKVVQTAGQAGTEKVTTTYTYDPATGTFQEAGVTRTPVSKVDEVIRVGNQEKVTSVLTHGTVYQADSRSTTSPDVVKVQGKDGSQTVTTTYTVDPKTGSLTNPVTSTVKQAAVDTVILVGSVDQKTTVVPYSTVTKTNSDLDKGVTRVVVKGADGSVTEITRYTVDPATGARTFLATDVQNKAAVNEVIEVGTKVTEVKTTEEKTVIAYKTVYVKDPALKEGEQVKRTAGVNGLRTVTYRDTYVNGVLTSHEVASDVTKKAVDEVIAVGVDVTTTSKTVTRTPISYPVQYVDNNTLSAGTTRVKQQGVEGYKETVTEITYVDGVETARRVVSEKTVAPIAQIIERGTKEAAPSATPSEPDPETDSPVQSDQEPETDTPADKPSETAPDVTADPATPSDQPPAED